ncbi:TonB-dependent receptor [Sphingomonas sp. CL5.1]|uniref:TonB-dependent receptor n=1 Tax=Sphingomonas sp. CL5.1 TaxID=2653203 RepID=UPI0015842A91|nr:TonB-dependent receptor [Sphingomonas sp. CL5.1]QKR99929.1 TonB-dependent receptor [Sphingomonas sp. CL5.1]
MRGEIRLTIRAAMLVALSTTALSAAHAQITSAPGADVPPLAAIGDSQNSGDIVVTALRSTDRLQTAPAAISVVTADTAKAAGVASLADVSKVVPALRFETGIRPGVPTIAIRGIAAIQQGEAPVSILIDGVQVPFLSIANMDLLDITDVELLKGPQGALYGRGAIAGALVINTRQPDNDFRASGRFTAQEGADYKGILTVSGPLIEDRLYAKITGSYQNRRGLLYNSTRHDYSDFVDSGTLDGEIVYQPTPSTRLALSAMYTRGTVGSNYLELTTIAGLTDFSTSLKQNFWNRDLRRLFRTSLTLDQDTPIGTLTVIGQYARARDYVITDIDYTQAAGRYNYNPELDDAKSIDARLTSKPGSRFQWMFGAAYQDRYTENNINLLADPAATTPQITGITYQTDTSKSYGVYGRASYDIGAGFTVIGALRYDRDKKYDVLTNVPGTGLTSPFTAWQPSATLKWQAQKDLMFYATFGQGFRSGGFNAASVPFDLVGAQRVYPKEISRNYEAGFKAQFADHRITLNADVYRTDYDNAQFQRTIIGATSFRFITSIRKAHVNGIEADLTIKPVDDVTLGGSYSLSASRIDDFNGTSLYVGNPMPNAFHDNETAYFSYAPRFDDTYHGLLRFDMNRRGYISYNLSNNVNFQPATTFNARLGIESERWSVDVFWNNITNKRYPEFVFPDFMGTIQGRLANQPSRAGIELNFNFGAR